VDVVIDWRRERHVRVETEGINPTLGLDTATWVSDLTQQRGDGGLESGLSTVVNTLHTTRQVSRCARSELKREESLPP
jgi:hypothetical protein